MTTLKWLSLTKPEMRAHLEECFPEYTIEEEGGKWMSFMLRKACPDFDEQSLYAYTYSDKQASESERCKWYFSFYNMYWKESKEAAITEGMTLYYKEMFEKLQRLEHLMKQMTNRITSINKDEAGLRDWKIRKALE